MTLGFRARLTITYAVDWTIAVVVALFANFYLDRFQQIPEFDLTDTSIQFSFKQTEIVSNTLLVFLLLIPYIFILIGNLVFNFKDWWDLHVGLLALTVSYSLAGTFVEVVRINLGRPRPDFIARCNPPPNSTNAVFFGLANLTICQTSSSDPIIRDGMRSFFSGHAILSAAGFGFISLYWAAKMQLFSKKADTFKVWLVSLPIVVSIWICLTRVSDRRHHPSDVIFGFWVGLLIVYAVYRQFYPPLNHPECHQPYGPRITPRNVRPASPPRPTSLGEWLPLSDVSGPRSTTRGQQLVESDLERQGLITSPLRLERDAPRDETAAA